MSSNQQVRANSLWTCSLTASCWEQQRDHLFTAAALMQQPLSQAHSSLRNIRLAWAHLRQLDIAALHLPRLCWLGSWQRLRLQYA